MKFKWHLSLLAFAFSLFVTGCATTSTPTTSSSLSDAEKSQAKVERLLNKASTAKPEKSAQLKTEAAQILLGMQAKTQALEILDTIPLQLIPAASRYEMVYLRAEAALSNNDPEQARFLLEQIEANENNTYTEEQEIQRLHLLTTTFEQQENTLSALKTLIKISRLNKDNEQQQILHDKIWGQLRLLSNEEISQNIRSGSLNYYEQGWLELAYELNSHKQLDTQHQAFANWSTLWESHPATKLPPSALSGLTQETFRAKKIAILLPYTGKLAKPAKAIKEGILQAHLRQNNAGQTPELLFLNSEKINSPIQLAAIINEEAVDFVIGPLNKDFVAALATDQHLNTPILALNYASDQGRTNFYQFGLSAEDEARQVAETIWKDGKQSIATLSPSTSWGQRIGHAFNEHFSALGGKVVTQTEYIDGSELATKVSNLFNTDLSTQRHKTIRSILGKSIEFEEHRRTDIDSIFIVALPNEARQIKPILSFNFAGDLPVYATSHVYSGRIDPIQDQDLNNIRFCDTPWSLNPPSQDKILLTQLRENTNSRFGKLYALGLDAYRIFPYLNQLSHLPGTEIQGETGTLSIEENGLLQRQLLWATFKDGTPQLTQ